MAEYVFRFDISTVPVAISLLVREGTSVSLYDDLVQTAPQPPAVDMYSSQNSLQAANEQQRSIRPRLASVPSSRSTAKTGVGGARVAEWGSLRRS